MDEVVIHKIKDVFIKVATKCTDEEYKVLQVHLSKYCCLICLPDTCNSLTQVTQSVSQIEQDHMYYLHDLNKEVVLLFRCSRKLKNTASIIQIDSTFLKLPDWKSQLVLNIESLQRLYTEEKAIAKINGTLLPAVKGVSALYRDIGTKNNTISIMASGTSINELTDKELDFIKKNSLMIGINYSVVRFNPDVLIWSDNEPAHFLNQFYKSNKKETILLGSVHSVKENHQFNSLIGTEFWQNVDYWWTTKGMLKNLTLTWLLQLIHDYFPPNIKVLLFGVDLYGTEKWYDSYMSFDKAKKLLGKSKKDDEVGITGKDLDRTQFFLNELLRLGKIPSNIYNCNPKSKLDLFEKVSYKEML